MGTAVTLLLRFHACPRQHFCSETAYRFSFHKINFAVAAFRTYAVFVQSDTAQRATVDLVFRLEFARGGIYTAGKRYFGNIEFIFQQVVHDFNHSLNRHRFFRNHHDNRDMQLQVLFIV